MSSGLLLFFGMLFAAVAVGVAVLMSDANIEDRRKTAQRRQAVRTGTSSTSNSATPYMSDLGGSFDSGTTGGDCSSGSDGGGGGGGCD